MVLAITVGTQVVPAFVAQLCAAVTQAVHAVDDHGDRVRIAGEHRSVGQLKSSWVTKCQRSLEARIDLGHQPVWQDANALLEGAAIEGRELRDVDDGAPSRPTRSADTVTFPGSAARRTLLVSAAAVTVRNSERLH
jgi:hypothetical protein